MDFHALQRKLFQMDPTDPREDLKKLQAQARAHRDVAPSVNYLEESAKVNPGSLPLPGLDLNSFARLAGVRLDEKQKTGSAGQAKGSDPMPKAKAGRTKHPLKDKLVGGESLDEAPKKLGFASGFQAVQPGGAIGPDAVARKAASVLQPKDQNSPTPAGKQPGQKIKSSVGNPQLAKLLNIQDLGTFNQAVTRAKSGQELSLVQQRSLAGAFVNLMKMDPQQTQQAMLMLKRMEAESIEEKKEPEPPKQRNPVAAYAQRSGAGVHKDQNKKNTPPRKEKHKSKSLQYESIKDRLWEALNRNK